MDEVWRAGKAAGLHRILPVALLLLAIQGTAEAGSYSLIVGYDPAKGLLPDSVGFERYASAERVQPELVQGELHQFRQTPIESPWQDGGGRTQSWIHKVAGLDFSKSVYVLEATLKVVSSDYIPNIGTGQRSGYYLWTADSSGRYFAVGIAGEGITINTDYYLSQGNGLVFKPFNSTDGYHTYRLLIAQNQGRLFIDGKLFGVVPLGEKVYPQSPAQASFGDIAGYGSSETFLKVFRFYTAGGLSCGL